MEEVKPGEVLPKPKAYVVPARNRYAVLPTSDTRFYIFDYVKYTTINDENNVIRMFGRRFDADQELNRLIATYQREIDAKPVNLRALLKTYEGEILTEVKEVELPENYDGNPYGDTVPFTVGSNQTLTII